MNQGRIRNVIVVGSTVQVELHDNGLPTDDACNGTRVPGVFACGDVQDFTYRHAVTAVWQRLHATLDASARWPCKGRTDVTARSRMHGP